jgi:hypothetical protein
MAPFIRESPPAVIPEAEPQARLSGTYRNESSLPPEVRIGALLALWLASLRPG